MDAVLHLIGTFLLDNTKRSVVVVLILLTLVIHLVRSYRRTGSREISKNIIFGSNTVDVLRAGFSVLFFITGVRILGTVLTIETCGRLSEDDFIIFGTVGMFTCLVLGALEIKTALFGKKVVQAR